VGLDLVGHTAAEVLDTSQVVGTDLGRTANLVVAKAGQAESREATDSWVATTIRTIVGAGRIATEEASAASSLPKLATAARPLEVVKSQLQLQHQVSE
jgi:ribose 5-phosphate isomerase